MNIRIGATETYYTLPIRTRVFEQNHFELSAWLKDNCKGKYYTTGWSPSIDFTNEQDAILYTLRWL